MFVFFQHTLRQAVVATLKYFGYKTVNDVPLPLKEMKKEEVGIELLLKENVKTKDPNELTLKDNLTGANKSLICIIYLEKWVTSLFKDSTCRPL